MCILYTINRITGSCNKCHVNSVLAPAARVANDDSWTCMSWFVLGLCSYACTTYISAALHSACKNLREGSAKRSGVENRWVQAASMMLRLDGCSQKIAVRWFTLPLKWTSLKGPSMASRWDVPMHCLVSCSLYGEKFHRKQVQNCHGPGTNFTSRPEFDELHSEPNCWQAAFEGQMFNLINFVSWWSLLFFDSTRIDSSFIFNYLLW